MLATARHDRQRLETDRGHGEKHHAGPAAPRCPVSTPWGFRRVLWRAVYGGIAPAAGICRALPSPRGGPEHAPTRATRDGIGPWGGGGRKTPTPPPPPPLVSKPPVQAYKTCLGSQRVFTEARDPSECTREASSPCAAEPRAGHPVNGSLPGTTHFTCPRPFERGPITCSSASAAGGEGRRRRVEGRKNRMASDNLAGFPTRSRRHLSRGGALGSSPERLACLSAGSHDPHLADSPTVPGELPSSMRLWRSVALSSLRFRLVGIALQARRCSQAPCSRQRCAGSAPGTPSRAPCSIGRPRVATTPPKHPSRSRGAAGQQRRHPHRPRPPGDVQAGGRAGGLARWPAHDEMGSTGLENEQGAARTIKPRCRRRRWSLESWLELEARGRRWKGGGSMGRG